MIRATCLILVFSLSASALAQMSPEATVKSLQVADGLEVTLFAAEPMLMKPADIDVDALGQISTCPGLD